MKAPRLRLLTAAPALGVLLCGAAVSLSAQQQPFPVGPRTIVGIVVDSNGVAVDSAQVYLTGPRDRVYSARDGTFRINGVKTEIAIVSARKIGYFPQTRRVVLQPNGSSVRFELVPLTQNLPAVVTRAKSSGLSGVVGDTSYGAIAKATVKVVASGAGSTETDSMGAFFLPVKTGRYMVEIRKPGFKPQIVSVTIPEDEGRRISVLMTPGANEVGPRTAAYLDAFKDRQIYRSSANSRMFTREDVGKMNQDMEGLVNVGAVRRVDPSCEVYIDGGRERLPIWVMNPMDYEFIEVYAKPPVSPVVGSRLLGRPDAPLNSARSGVATARGLSGGTKNSGFGGGGAATGAGRNADGSCNTLVYAWTRK